MEPGNNTTYCLMVADGGSTKADWCIALTGQPERVFRTRGFNPALLDTTAIRETLSAELSPQLERFLPHERVQVAAYYYGAGCLPSVCTKVETALASILPEGSVAKAHSDLLGAARALCGHSPGVACILGTGSNCCLYDGNDIAQRVPPLGYVLGDEGSGTALGKRLLGDWLKGLLPGELSQSLQAYCGMDEAGIIQRVYRQPEANRFLASFAPFLGEHLAHPHVRQMVTDCFRDFFERNVNRFRTTSRTVHFVGGVAYAFREPLESTAREYGWEVGNILREPVRALADFHRKQAERQAEASGD